MKRRRHPWKLSRREEEFLQMVLLDELEIQAWFAVTYSLLLGREELITIQ